MNTSSKIFHSVAELLPLLNSWKTEGQKIVFTNGCFDLVHLGHVDYLEKSRNLGDKLVLGLNTDASVNDNKGTERPIVDEVSRARVMASMQFVDAVILFNEKTPYELICQIVPDVLVKGNDYSIENIVGADFVISKGGEVKTIELVKGYSTTSIVNKIKSFK
ncbi:MAG: D-glycero-beta-D-manno-heptose 1-phosphate adenylyltransferase [Cytophagales bacterium]